MRVPQYLAVEEDDLTEDVKVANVNTVDIKPKIQIHGRHFVDEQGRVVHLRGANVGSASKV